MTYLSWNATNWATVFLMAVGGFLIVKLVGIGIQKVRGNAAA